jgi:hypothetical protein
MLEALLHSHKVHIVSHQVGRQKMLESVRVALFVWKASSESAVRKEESVNRR